MSAQVTFASKAGGQLGGAISDPVGSGSAGGLVVVQEWWGLNDQIRSMCDRFAQAGLLALAPDLFHGKRPKDQSEAAEAMTALDKQKAVAEIGDAVAHLKSHPRCNGKVGVTGFCLGGGLTLAAARHVEGIAAAVAFYGLPGILAEEYAKVRVPIQAHFAKRDDWAKASVAEEIKAKVRGGGGQMDLFVYDAGHAFMRDTDPQVYNEQAARLAWDRTIEFLKKHLG
jgi:carboxymethylenebutenolidase